MRGRDQHVKTIAADGTVTAIFTCISDLSEVLFDAGE